jgi:nicotinamidase-related amidase
MSENDRSSARFRVDLDGRPSYHPPMHTALILIDIQESFRHRPTWSDAELPRMLDRTGALIRGAERRGMPIVRVLHEDPGDATNPFAAASGHVRPLTGLAAYTPALEVVKHRHSALAGTVLPIWLRSEGIGRIIVAGIRTEQCCETTTRHASDEGFDVDYVTEATLTFAMKRLDGTPIATRDLMAHAEAVLAGRFATICTVDEAIERAR